MALISTGMARAEALRSFAYTRWASRHRQSRARFQTAQRRALDHWLMHSVPNVAAFQGFAGVLSDMPVMDKSRLMADFAAFNRPGFTADQLRASMAEGDRLGGYLVGASTGTSGNRGLFVISERERFRWLGAILAKTIADLLWRPQRVAIILPQGGGLYDSANRLRRLDLRFFDLVTGPERWRRDLEGFNPTVIVAPPKILRHFAEDGYALSPKRVFSAAETLDPVDRPVIETRFGGPLRQIYMASEGLLGVTCSRGQLHLAEDSVFFEYEDVGDGLVNPVISSFRRDVQILARYRMNDLLRLSGARCACGSPLQAVEEIVGRLDDCFTFAAPHGPVLVTPDVLRNAVLNTDPRIDDFRLIQTAEGGVELHLKPGLDPQIPIAAGERLGALLSKRGIDVDVVCVERSLPLQTRAKLRRVARVGRARGF